LNPALIIPQPEKILNKRGFSDNSRLQGTTVFFIDENLGMGYIFKIKGTRPGLKGKTVQGRHGPAAVAGDEIHRATVPDKGNGKAWRVERSGSQKTCL
jgi:hypothetical protein